MIVVVADRFFRIIKNIYYDLILICYIFFVLKKIQQAQKKNSFEETSVGKAKTIFLDNFKAPFTQQNHIFSKLIADYLTFFC